MAQYEGYQFATEGLLNVAQHCAQAALHAPLLTGRTDIKVEVLTGDDVRNMMEAEGVVHAQGVFTTGEGVSNAAARFGEPPILVLIGADCSPLLKAPCRAACPAGVDIPRHIRLTGDGEHAQAAQVLREKVPFPASIGRVCRAPCEQKCRRAVVCDTAISIRPLHRFATDQAGKETYIASTQAPDTGRKVAVIGAGPAGLTAAYFLKKVCGHAVTVFEAMTEAGGMMRAGIPEYRLPRKMLNADIEAIQKAGVEIKTNTRIESVEVLIKEGYDAVFVAVGSHRGTKLGIDGEDSPGVLDGATFLRDVNTGKKVDVGERVAVIGGGNTAVDAARVALRLGAREVKLIYRRTQAEMPASPEEVADAQAEGVILVFESGPCKITRDKARLKLECVRMQMGAPDASGRPAPTPVAGSETTEEYTTVIAAIGQAPDVPKQFALKLGGGNTIQVDAVTMQTSQPGVFAGGDAVVGEGTVIEAIAAGRKAASEIDKYLGGLGRIEDVIAPPEQVPDERKAHGPEGQRPVPAKRLLSKGEHGFAEVEQAFTEEQALGEDTRCLNCDCVGYDCGACGHKTCRAAVAYTNNKINDTGGEPWGWIWKGPSCIWRIMELGIAVEWACAASHNLHVGTRAQMVTGGLCMRIGYMEGCTAVMSLAIGPVWENWYFEPGSRNEAIIPPWVLQSRQRISYTPLWLRFGGPGRDMGLMGIKMQDKWWDAPYTKIDITTDDNWWKFIWNRDYAIFAACDQIRKRRGVTRLNLPGIKKVVDKKISQVP
jgi:formate dehydrogenase beta subunit